MEKEQPRHLLQRILKIYPFRFPLNLNLTFIAALFCVVLFRGSTTAQSQYLGVSATYDDSFSEWVIYSIHEEEETEDLLRLKWPLRNDWSQWLLETEDDFISIQQTWTNRSNAWQLRHADGLVTMQMKWRNDPTEWRISYGDYNITWKSEYKNEVGLWILDHKDHGYFEMYNEFENDPRDWLVVDESILPDPIKQALLFIVLEVCTPKN